MLCVKIWKIFAMMKDALAFNRIKGTKKRAFALDLKIKDCL